MNDLISWFTRLCTVLKVNEVGDEMSHSENKKQQGDKKQQEDRTRFDHNSEDKWMVTVKTTTKVLGRSWGEILMAILGAV